MESMRPMEIEVLLRTGACARALIATMTARKVVRSKVRMEAMSDVSDRSILARAASLFKRRPRSRAWHSDDRRRKIVELLTDITMFSLRYGASLLAALAL